MSSSSGSDEEIVVPVKRMKRRHHPVAGSNADKIQKFNLYSHKILPKLDALNKSPVKINEDEDEGNESVPFNIDCSDTLQEVSTTDQLTPKQDSGNEKSVSDSSPTKIVPPTPPPPFRPRRKGRRGRKTTKILKEVTSVLSQVGHLDSSQNDSVIEVEEDCVDVAKETMIKIRFHGKVQRFPHIESEPFAEVFEKLAKRAKVAASRLLVTFGDRRVFPSETPIAIQLSIADILDCVVAHKRLAPDVKDTVRIQMQGPFQRKKVLFTMGKSESFLAVMEEYGRKSKVDLKELEFHFDGEYVDPTSTPKSLDMENDDCMDVMHVKKP